MSTARGKAVKGLPTGQNNISCARIQMSDPGPTCFMHQHLPGPEEVVCAQSCWVECSNLASGYLQ